MNIKKNFTLIFSGVFILALLYVYIYSFNAENEQPAQQRTVLVEKFTGTWCGWCPYGVEILDNILDKTDNVVVLAYHTRDTDSMTIATTKVLQDAFDPKHPQAVIDRVQYPETEKLPISRDDWDRTITYRLGAAPFLLIDIEGNYDPGSRKVDLDVKFQPGKDFLEGRYMINFVITENGLKYTQKIFRDPDRKEIPGYIHNHVVREMVTGPTGMELKKKPTVIDDENVTILEDMSYSFVIDKEYIAENCHIVVFVHEDKGDGFGPVQNAAEISIKVLAGFRHDNR
ncbi:Omp28-related outer membrane protein [candidate division KSB1 bacterium]